VKAVDYWEEAHFLSEAAFWIEVLAEDERCKQRAQLGGFIWHEAEPGVLLIRTPAFRDDGLAEAGPVGPLIRRAILGFADIIGRPDFLNDPWFGTSNPTQDSADACTQPNTDARLVELALKAQQHPARVHKVIQLYLAEISRVQHDFGIPPGTGEQTYRFISHYWGLGDIGVGQKFASIAPQLRARTRSSTVSVPVKTNLETRLLTLERGIRQRQT